MRNLIICPVGGPVTYDSRFAKERHWRFCHSDRLYETLVFQYSDFTPEEFSYDKLIKQKGFKWSLSKEYFAANEYSEYEYIGFMDDDLITDVDNINRALKIAKEFNSKIFQLSVTQDSDEFFPILKNKPGIKYTKTNFVETMGMFFHTSLLPTVKDFWNRYDIYCGWGFDKVLCDITKEDAAVIHASQMIHPKKYSSGYDKTKAFQEMDKVLYQVTPQFMKDKYNEEWSFIERQYEKEMAFDTE